MDASMSQADSSQIASQLQVAGLQLRRIDAELAGTVPEPQPDDDPERSSRCWRSTAPTARRTWMPWQRARGARAAPSRDSSGRARDEAKLRETLPIYQDQERAWKQLVDEGFAGRLLAEERKRQRIEAEQELKAQAHAIEGARASIQQSRKRIAQLESTYRQDLYNERVETTAQHQSLTQEWEKQAHRNELLELKAPQEGTIKDLATHTEGAVLQPGHRADDHRSGRRAAARRGVGRQPRPRLRPRGAEGAGQGRAVPVPEVRHGRRRGQARERGCHRVAAQRRVPKRSDEPAPPAYQFRSIVELKAQDLEADGARHKLMPGMQVDAEIALGERTVMEYMLSPVRKAFHEAGRER